VSSAVPSVPLTLLISLALIAVPAAAASLGGGAAGGALSGSGAVAGCDTTVSLTYETSAGKVTSVTVGGIADPGCAGGMVEATLRGGGLALGTAGPEPVPADADTADDQVTLTVGAPQPAAADVDGAHVSIEGS
jgi:hypothetical protein